MADWEMPEGPAGPSRHVRHPELQLHTVDLPTHRFELRNTSTGVARPMRLEGVEQDAAGVITAGHFVEEKEG